MNEFYGFKPTRELAERMLLLSHDTVIDALNYNESVLYEVSPDGYKIESLNNHLLALYPHGPASEITRKQRVSIDECEKIYNAVYEQLLDELVQERRYVQISKLFGKWKLKSYEICDNYVLNYKEEVINIDK